MTTQPTAPANPFVTTPAGVPLYVVNRGHLDVLSAYATRAEAARRNQSHRKANRHNTLRRARLSDVQAIARVENRGWTLARAGA